MKNHWWCSHCKQVAEMGSVSVQLTVAWHVECKTVVETLPDGVVEILWAEGHKRGLAEVLEGLRLARTAIDPETQDVCGAAGTLARVRKEHG